MSVIHTDEFDWQWHSYEQPCISNRGARSASIMRGRYSRVLRVCHLPLAASAHAIRAKHPTFVSCLLSSFEQKKNITLINFSFLIIIYQYFERLTNFLIVEKIRVYFVYWWARYVLAIYRFRGSSCLFYFKETWSRINARRKVNSGNDQVVRRYSWDDSRIRLSIWLTDFQEVRRRLNIFLIVIFISTRSSLYKGLNTGTKQVVTFLVEDNET